MENMAEEELLPQEKEKVEVAQVQVPTPAPDSARVPAPAPDTAPAPDSAPTPAPALAPAPAPSRSLACAPDEAESSKCRRPRSFCCRRTEKRAPCWGGPSALGWLFMGKGRFRETGGGRRDPCSAENGDKMEESVSTNLEDITMKVMGRPGVLQNKVESFFVKGGLFPVQK